MVTQLLGGAAVGNIDVVNASYTTLTVIQVKIVEYQLDSTV